MASATMALLKNKGKAKDEAAKAAEQELDTDTGDAAAAEAAPATGTATKAKAKKKEPPPVNASADPIQQTAKELENVKDAETAEGIIRNTQEDAAFGEFRIGGALAVIQTNGWFGEHPNFKAYVESTFGIGYRKAMYLISTYTKLVESGVAWEQVSHLGWTKLKEIAGILTPKNVKSIAKKAETMTVLQLQEWVEKEKAKAQAGGKPASETPDEDGASKLTTKTFKVKPDQKETIEAAIEKAKVQIGTNSDTVAIEHICIDFANGTQSNATAKQPTLAYTLSQHTLEEVMKAFERVFPGVEAELQLKFEGADQPAEDVPMYEDDTAAEVESEGETVGEAAE